MSFPVKFFDLRLDKDLGGTSIALIGASKSGKTTMMKYLYKDTFTRHIGVCFTMNPHAPIYKDLFGSLMPTDVYHPELIVEAHEINKRCHNRFPFLFISDDYVDTKIKNCPEITRLLTIYRNSNISALFSFQGRTLMNAVGRNNLNYVCIFKQQTPAEYENVIKEYLSMWLPPEMTMREMVEFVMRCTQDHHFFFIDNIKGECYISKLNKIQLEFAEKL